MRIYLVLKINKEEDYLNIGEAHSIPNYYKNDLNQINNSHRNNNPNNNTLTKIKSSTFNFIKPRFITENEVREKFVWFESLKPIQTFSEWFDFLSFVFKKYDKEICIKTERNTELSKKELFFLITNSVFPAFQI